jgi:recombination associated protein RdgC
MGIISGAITVRRFKVVGSVPEEFRELYRERLQEHAFREPAVPAGKEEVEGWVEVQNLLDAGFEDMNRWLMDRYIVLALRVDKKSLPAKLLRATLEKKAQAWCEERGVERCPRAVKDELREELESQWLKRVLPNVSVTEAVWNHIDGYVLVHTTSDATCDRFRRRFHRTFGLQLVPWSPLDFVDDDDLRDALLSTSPITVEGGA